MGWDADDVLSGLSSALQSAALAPVPYAMRGRRRLAPNGSGLSEGVVSGGETDIDSLLEALARRLLDHRYLAVAVVAARHSLVEHREAATAAVARATTCLAPSDLWCHRPDGSVVVVVTDMADGGDRFDRFAEALHRGRGVPLTFGYAEPSPCESAQALLNRATQRLSRAQHRLP